MRLPRKQQLKPARFWGSYLPDEGILCSPKLPGVTILDEKIVVQEDIRRVRAIDPPVMEPWIGAGNLHIILEEDVPLDPVSNIEFAARRGHHEQVIRLVEERDEVDNPGEGIGQDRASQFSRFEIEEGIRRDAVQEINPVRAG